MGFDLEEIYQKHDFKKAANIIENPHKPGHTLILPLPLG